MQWTQDVLTTAAQSTFLRGLSQPDLLAVLNCAHWQHRQAGAYFFMENTPAETTCLLITGKAKILQVTPNGQQVLLGYAIPGQMFGLVAMLNDIPYPVSIQAVGACQALGWDRPSRQLLLQRYPILAQNTIQILAQKVILFQKRLREMATQQVEQRIAHALLRLAAQVGRKVEDGILIDMPLSRQDLAEMTGATIYTVSRVLKDWEKRNLVQVGRMKVLISHPHRLVLLAEGRPE